MRFLSGNILFMVSLVLFIAPGQARCQSDFIEKSEQLELYHSYKDGNLFGGGVTFFDFNRDGLDDLSFSSGMGDPLQFYISTSDGFVDVGNMNLSETRESKQLLWVDFDNDYDYDLFVTNYEGPVRLWENLGNMEFENITFKAGLPIIDMPVFGAAWGDYDRDGFLDLFVPNYSNPTNTYEQQRNYLFRNRGDGTFEEVADRQNVLLHGPTNHYFSGAFLDLNNTLWPDLFIIQDFGNSIGVTGNILFWNDHGNYLHAHNCGSLEDIRMSAMCIASGDFDKNGFLDVYITNTPFLGSKFHVNQGDSTFLDMAESMGIVFSNEGFGWGAQFFDYDNDTWEDLAVVGDNPTPTGQPQIDRLYRNLQSQGFLPLGQNSIDLTDSSRSVSVAYGDYNGDGMLDFAIATTKSDSIKFYENTVENNNNFLVLNLVGTLSNADGIGSRVEIYHDRQKQIRYTSAGLGFLSQNSSKIYFGLGASPFLDSVLVKWPSGWTDTYYNASANQFLTFTEGETANFRFDIVGSHTELSETVQQITLSAPEFVTYNWNNDQSVQNIVVNKSGVYVCSVVDAQGQKGLSNKLFISQRHSETPQVLLRNQEVIGIKDRVIHPNPTTGIFRIEDPNLTGVEVYNSLGKRILSTNKREIDLSSHPNGLYFLFLRNDAKKSVRLKLFKVSD